MNPSSNSFEQKVIAQSINTFASDDPEQSTNTFAKDSLPQGQNAWEGDNLTSGPPIGDEMSGYAPGIGEAGGIAHFKARVNPSISH